MSRHRHASLDPPNGATGPPVPPPDHALDPPASRPPKALVGPRMGRRVSSRKLLLGAALVGSAALLIGVLGSWLGGAAARWLQRQPRYQLPFEQIALEPSPPPWIRVGAEGLLRDVRACSEWRETGTIGMLDLDLRALAGAFGRCSPWVRGVRSIVRSYPNRVAVHLEYREPVAVWKLGRGPARSIVLDGDGVVLPAEDLDPGRAGPLVGLQLAVPPGSRLVESPGRRLAREPDTPGESPVEIAGDACRLAAFLKEKGVIAGAGTNRSPLLVAFIHQNRYGLWIQTVEDVMIRWGVPPGREEPGEPPAERKWALLMEWLGRHRLEDFRTRDDDPESPYLTFGRDEVLVAYPPRPEIPGGSGPEPSR